MVTVIECGTPYVTNSGKDCVVVKLAVQPSGKHVYYRPWTGKTKDGDFRDNIAEFLKAVNRAPKVGDEPNWNAVLGAKGKCKIRQGEWNGDVTNEVSFFYVPRDTKTATTRPDPNVGQAQSASVDEFQKMRKQKAAGGGGGQVEEDDIPYACDRG
jgi:hypothetical protein